jgi:hypothetical protein
MSGRKLIVDWKHTADELYARYKHEPNTHIARRFQALALLRRGKTLKETAAIVGVCLRAVQKWLAWYRTDGVDALAHRRRGGNRRPVRPLLTPNQQAQLVHHAATQGFRTLWYARSARLCSCSARRRSHSARRCACSARRRSCRGLDGYPSPLHLLNLVADDAVALLVAVEAFQSKTAFVACGDLASVFLEVAQGADFAFVDDLSAAH